MSVSITLFNSDGKCFISCDDKGTIYATDKETAVDSIEGAYNAKHRQSYEGSMSACIHYMFFNPRVVTVKDLDEIKKHIASNHPGLCHLRHVSGFAYGITCRPEAMQYWKKADQPKLISI
jgi:WD40 repeat protein